MTMNTISVLGTTFPVSDQGLQAEQAALSEYQVCCGTEKKKFNRIKMAVDGFACRVRVRAYASSFACRYVAMVEQARDLETEKRLPLTVYLSLAKQLSLFKPIPELTEFWDKPKTKGGTRRLHDFGPLNRAAQYMVMRVTSAIFKPRQFQYNVSGGGTVKAIESIKKKIAEGYVHTKKLDVQSFFASFSRKGLYQLLPFPKPIIDNVVMPENLKLKPKC